MNAVAQAAKKSGDISEDNDENEEEEMIEGSSLRTSKSIASRKQSIADRQAVMIANQRRDSASSSTKEVPSEEKKLFWCPSCPYTNYRRDAVDNHHKRHISVSGLTNNYTCDHCDYSVPQVHFLRDHIKLHFMPNKVNITDGYMICDNMKLSSTKIVNGEDEEGETPHSSDTPHDETDMSNPEESKEVELAKKMKELANELLAMHGITDEEESEEGESETPEGGEGEERKEREKGARTAEQREGGFN